MSRGMQVAINVVVYQCAWFACVLGAATGRPVAGLVVAAVAVLWHLYTARRPLTELVLVGIATLAGAAFEALLLLGGAVRAAPAFLVGGLLPLSMVALWAAFATTLNVSLRALRQRYLACALLAAVAAPLAYAAGARLGALQWVEDGHGLLLVGIGWAVLMPLLMKSAQRFDGFAPT
jgi:hypothetical protein